MRKERGKEGRGGKEGGKNAGNNKAERHDFCISAPGKRQGTQTHTPPQNDRHNFYPACPFIPFCFFCVWVLCACLACFLAQSNVRTLARQCDCSFTSPLPLTPSTLYTHTHTQYQQQQHQNGFAVLHLSPQAFTLRHGCWPAFASCACACLSVPSAPAPPP